MRDRPELTGDDIRNPEQQFDPTTNQPNVTFDFTDEGREAFQEVTRRIALRGAERAGSGVSAEQASEASDSFAVVLDGEIVSRPIINFVENPDGIDGRTGAQISGNFTIQEAQDLAEFLRIGALPIDLTLISQSTVSATLGAGGARRSDRRRARRPGAGAPLPARLLPVPRLRRGAGPVRLRPLLPRADQADPDHADVAGHRGPDPHDRRRGGLQHRDLRAHQGRGAPRAVDAVGDLGGLPQGHRDDHRRQRDHPDHGVHPVRARDGRREGVRVHPGHRHHRLSVHRRPVHPGGPGRARQGAVPALAAVPGGPRARRATGTFDFTGLSKYFFSASGIILTIGAIAFSTQQLNLGIDFESGTRIKAALGEAATSEDVRTALAEAGIDGDGRRRDPGGRRRRVRRQRLPGPGQDPRRSGAGGRARPG